MSGCGLCPCGHRVTASWIADSTVRKMASISETADAVVDGAEVPSALGPLVAARVAEPSVCLRLRSFVAPRSFACARRTVRGEMPAFCPASTAALSTGSLELPPR